MYSMFQLACLIIINRIQSLNLFVRCQLIDKQRAGSCFVVFWFKVESAYHESFFVIFKIFYVAIQVSPGSLCLRFLNL